MRNLTLTLTAFFSFSALAAPPSGVNAPGLERVCEGRDTTDPDEDLLDTSVTYLQDQALIEAEAAAAMVDSSLVIEDSSVTISGGSVLFAGHAQVDVQSSNFLVLRPVGFTTLGLGEAELALSEGSIITADLTNLDGKWTVQLTVFDEAGTKTDALSYSGASDDGTRQGMVWLGDGGPTGAVVSHMYGDIIIGSMCLDCFND